MILINLKYQLRQGLFLIPLMVIPLFFISKSYVVIFLFLQGRFFRVIQQNDFNFSLIHITGADLKLPLKSYNLSWTIWFNAWFIIAQIINVFWFGKTIQIIINELINFNILLFLCFIIGNTISNSDMITIKSGILRLISSSFIFGIGISFCYALLELLSILNITLFVNVILLIVIITIWYYHTQQQKRINFIQYYL